MKKKYISVACGKQRYCILVSHQSSIKENMFIHNVSVQITRRSCSSLAQFKLLLMGSTHKIEMPNRF